MEGLGEEASSLIAGAGSWAGSEIGEQLPEAVLQGKVSRKTAMSYSEGEF